MSAMRLYDISSTYDLIRHLADSGGDDQEWAQALSDLEDEATAKILAIGRIMQEQRATQKAISFELDRLEARAKAAANAEERLKQYVLDCMTQMGMDKVNDATITVALQKSPPSTVITDEHAVPERYRWGALKVPYGVLPADLAAIATIDYDRKAMLEAHKAGEDVPGVSFESKRHVRVR